MPFFAWFFAIVFYRNTVANVLLTSDVKQSFNIKLFFITMLFYEEIISLALDYRISLIQIW